MKVSVVMPAYNSEKYIRAAIRSVLDQTWTDFELIVVDDGSRDSTVNIVEGLAAEDSRVVLLKNAQNEGVASSRNRGVASAHGEWIAFLDSDDLWRKDKLEKQIAYLSQFPDAAIGYTASAFMDAEGIRYSYVMPAVPKTTYAMLMRGNLMSCSSVMVKTEWIRKYPMGAGNMHEDYAAWLQILREVPCAYGLNEPLLIYRLSANSKSGNRVRSAEMLYRAYRYVGFSALDSLWMTVRYMKYSVLKRRNILKSVADSP